MALALVHHLTIANNAPLPRIARWLAGLGEELLFEFVPKSDPKVRRLLAAPEGVFPSTRARVSSAPSRRVSERRPPGVEELDPSAPLGVLPDRARPRR